MTKDELIDEHRYWNVEHIDWWDGVYDNFKVDMQAKGIEVDKMYFSGFWSQGDGACFEGRVCDWDVVLKSLGYGNPVLIQHAMDNWHFSVKHSGHYYHENCTSFSADLPNPDGESDDWFIERYSPYPWDKEQLRSQAWLAILRDVDYDALEEALTDAFKDHMRELYKQLEKEYDYLTSDEVVWESLEANDMTAEVEETA